METFILVGGLILLIVFSIFRFLLLRSDPIPQEPSTDFHEVQVRKSLSGITFFQLLGLGWTLLGMAFKMEVFHFPKGGARDLLGALLLLVPVWAFAFYLEKRNKKK